MRDPRYDVLFEPVRIGPLTAKNRFFQVPHCNGMGYRDPSAMAEMRAVKAEGGWAVVCTEEAEIHYSSDPSGTGPGMPTSGCWWQAPVRPAWRRPWPWASAATR